VQKESWIGQLYETCPFEYVYPEFLSHIERMEICPDYIFGKVLVIGQASAFPEKTLVCSAETYYRQLRPEVESIFLCDPDPFSSPSTQPDIPCINTITMGEISSCQPSAAYWELTSSYYYLQKTPKDFFDTVMMFRAVDTGYQIVNNGLISTITPHLKKGGYIILSGGRFPEDISEGVFAPLKVLKLTPLINYSGGFPFVRNMGVILQK